MTGNHPAVPRQWNETFAAVTRSYGGLCALAIRYVGGVPELPFDRALLDGIPDRAGGVPIWELKQALPRAYAVGAIQRMADDGQVQAALASPFDPRLVAFTTEDGIAGGYPGSANCRIHWSTDDPDRIEIEASSDSASFLVIADSWFPGWRATVDERPVHIYRVQHMLRGISLPAGSHRIHLDYEPEGWASAVRWMRGAWLLWMTIAAVALVHRLRRRRSPGEIVA